jgi:hypothetical protein
VGRPPGGAVGPLGGDESSLYEGHTYLDEI